MRRRFSLTFLIAFAGCSFALDFDDVEGLPCPCDNEHICLVPADRCEPRASVDDFKACETDTAPPGGNELCRPSRRCVAINGNGPRCLPTCTPTNFSTPEAAFQITTQCPQGNTCFPLPGGGGVCDMGECTDIPKMGCDINQECVPFNGGAGVCFTDCDIFGSNACGADQICHPIGDSSVLACVRSGERVLAEICTDTDQCAQTPVMICSKPIGSQDPVRTCRQVCDPANGGADCPGGQSCMTAVANIRRETGQDLGICIPTG